MNNFTKPNSGEPKAKKWETSVLIALCIGVFFLILLISNLAEVNRWFKAVLTIFRPIIIGLVIAYIAAPFFRLFEQRVLVRVRPVGLRRALSLLLTYAALTAIVVVLVMLIVPQLYDSTVNFVSNFEMHLTALIDGFNKILNSLNARIPPKTDGSPAFALLNLENIQKFFKQLGNSIFDFLKNGVNFDNFSYLFGILGKATSVITDIIFGIFVSLYLLASKEKRYAQIIRFRTAFFSETANARMTAFFSIADRSFGRFLRGKILDSTIVGFLTYFSCLIFRVPYPVLIGAVVGITDIVPVIGPFIGTIPAGLIIFLTDPVKVIPFVISIIVIQQIDGNVMAPKILGNQVGVSSFCVLSAIVIMGNLWGFAGMLLGVPIFATGSELIKKYLSKRLKERSLPDDMESYYNPETRADISDMPVEKPKKKNWFRNLLTPPVQSTDGKGVLTDAERMQLSNYSFAKDNDLFDVFDEEKAAELLSVPTPTEEEDKE